MNTIARVCLPLLLVSFLLTGCWFDDDDDDDEKEPYTILVYMAADNTLDGDVTYSLGQLRSGLTSKGAVVVYLDRDNQAPRLFKLTAGGNENDLKVYEEENSANAATLSQVIADTKKLVPSVKFGLVIWGHSMGWVPEDYQFPTRASSLSAGRQFPRTRYISIDDDPGSGASTYMEITDAAAALPASTAEFILFDVCLMASVEALYEIRHACDYVIAAPTEVLAEPDYKASGMPYAKILPYLYEGETGFKKACQAYYEYYRDLTYNGTDLNEDQAEQIRSATISLIDMRELDNLYAVTSGILQGKLAEAGVLDVSGFQVYHTAFIPQVFFDMGDVVAALSNDAQYLSFQAQLSKTVLSKFATDKFVTIPIDPNHFSGLSMYVPLAKWSANNEYGYYQSLDWFSVY